MRNQHWDDLEDLNKTLRHLRFKLIVISGAGVFAEFETYDKFVMKETRSS